MRVGHRQDLISRKSLSLSGAFFCLKYLHVPMSLSIWFAARFALAQVRGMNKQGQA